MIKYLLITLTGLACSASAGNLQQALELAGKNDPAGYVMLGKIYYDGMETNRDYSAAIANYSKAADAGIAEGSFRMALNHLYSWSPQHDVTKAVSYMRAASDKGHREAKLMLADILIESGNSSSNSFIAARQLEKEAYAIKPANANETGIALREWRTLKRRQHEAGRFGFTKISLIKQGHNMCGATSAAIVMAYRGRPIDPYSFKQEWPEGAREAGVPWDSIVRSAAKRGMEWKIATYTNDNSGFETGLAVITGEIDTGNPVICDISLDPDHPEKSAHTVVIAGYDNPGKVIYIMNPFVEFNGIQKYTYDEFKRLWKSIGFISTNKEAKRAIILTGRQIAM